MRLRGLFPSLGWPLLRSVSQAIPGIVAGAVAGSVLAAQTTTLSVRGGEHADFTRLVIHLPEANHWRLSLSERSATLQVTGPPLQFDLAQTFARIPRTRLRNVTAQPDALLLDLACDCQVRASEDIPQFLVIDIIGSAVIASPPARAALRPEPRPENPTAPRAAEATRAGQVLARALRDRSIRDPASTSLTLQQFFDTAQIAAPAQPLGTDRQPPVRSAITDEIGRALAGSVALGLLQGNEAFAGGDRAADMDQQTEVGRDFGTPDAHISIAPAGHDRLESGANSPSDAHDTCRDAELVDIALWGRGFLPDNGVFTIAELYGERDVPDPDHIRDLARYLLYLGFGAEARMVTQLHAEPSRDAYLLGQIGYLVDLEPVPEPDAIIALHGCSPISTFWAFLAAPTDGNGAFLRADMLTQAVQSLPPHLRIHLGPAVIQRLTLLGESEAAQLVRAAVDRVAQTPTPALQLARAALDLETGTAEDGIRAEGLLAPEQSDEALLFLLDRRERESQALEPGLLALAQDRLLALRGTEAGQRVAGHVLRAMLRAHAFNDAWAFLEQHPPHLRDAHHVAAHQDLLRAITQKADDPTFLTLVFAQGPWRAFSLDPALRDAVAERLESLGFYQQGALMRVQDEVSTRTGTPAAEQDATTAEGTDAAPPETDRLADAPPALYAPTQATAPLSHGAEALALDRARAAQALLAGAQDAASPTAPEAATRHGAEPASVDETTLPEPDSEADMAVPEPDERTRMIPGQTPAPAPEGLLGQGRAALAESAALRDRVQSLLGAPDTP